MSENFVRKRILEVLEKGYLLSLGTIDDGGVWVSEVIYVYDDNLNIYWMSKPSCRHSKALQKNSNIAGTITISNNIKDLDFGLQLSGKIMEVEENKVNLIIKFLKKKCKSIPQDPLKIMSSGFIWYKITPTKIDLIDQENFGYEKREMNIS